MAIKTVFIGRLGRDPEVRYTADEKQVTTLNVACKDWKETTWIKVVAFGKLAETCAEYLKKGSQIYGEAIYRVSEYENKDGEKKKDHSFTLREMEMIGSPPKQDDDSGDNAPPF